MSEQSNNEIENKNINTSDKVIPQGMEILLKLAGADNDWEKKIVKDPLSAADEAKIRLTPSEKAILKVAKPGVIQNMINSFTRTRLTSRTAGLLVGTAALLAITSGCSPIKGAKSDVPKKRTKEAVSETEKKPVYRKPPSKGHGADIPEKK